MRGLLVTRPPVALLSADLFPSAYRCLRLFPNRRSPIISAPTPPAIRRRLAATAISAIASAYKTEGARVPPALQPPVPPVSKFKIALCQLSVTPDKDRNVAHAWKAIEEAASKGAQLVLLPGRLHSRNQRCLQQGSTLQL